MKLRQIAANMTELETENAIVFFSYSTPVAAFDKVAGMYFKTERKFSVTTTQHITKWLAGVKAESMPQSYFEELVK